MTRASLLLSLCCAAPLIPWTGCKNRPADDDTGLPDWPVIEPAALEAGSADGLLELPVGTPLAAYTGRSAFFGGATVDGRDSDWAVNFMPSTGVQTGVPLRAIWLRSGDQHAVLIKIDIAYAFDGLVVALEQSIAEATGIDVSGQVVVMTSHSHSSYGDFSQAHFLYLGHDRFNRDVFERIVAQATAVAEEAHAALVPAAIGVGVDPGFDPDAEIATLRREEHMGLVDAYGVEVTEDYRDPNLYLLRIDASQGTEDVEDDEPLAIVFAFGIHGTVMGDSNPLISTETTGAIELKLANHFDHPVTLMHVQTDGGDMSPAGGQSEFARMELLGERAAPRILDLWEQVETTTAPLVLETVVRTVPMGRDMTVTRNGQVDWSYPPYEEGYEPDMVIYGDDGEPASPFDEFVARYGAALCGDDSIEIPFVSMEVDVFPYNSCALVDLVAALFPYIFYTDLYYDMEFPLWETRSTMVGALGLDAVPVTRVGEGTTLEQVVLGFIPGEPCTLLGRMFQKRMADEQGVTTAIPIGYALDHEGYVMTTDDWLRGGYEAQINIWGPLEGEYILERLLETAELLQTDVAEDPMWPDYVHQDYPEFPLEPVEPDASPGCGTVPDEIYEVLWTRDGWVPDAAQPPAVVRRMVDVAHMLWYGGDPAVDLPTVTLQREVTPGAGDFADVLLPDGEPLTDRGYDMILSYTPDPLVEPYGGADRHHIWLVEWQAVTDRPSLDHAAGLETGRYRFAVRGQCPDPADGEYPFDGIGYQITSDPFTVTGEDALEVTLVAQEGANLDLAVAYRAAPRGFRLLHADSDYRTPTPVVGGDAPPAVTVEVLDAGGSVVETLADLDAPASGDASAVSVALDGVPAGEVTLRVIDAFGNDGTLAVTIP